MIVTGSPVKRTEEDIGNKWNSENIYCGRGRLEWKERAREKDLNWSERWRCAGSEKKDRKLNAKTGCEARGLVRWRGTDVTAEGPDEGNPEKDGAP